MTSAPQDGAVAGPRLGRAAGFGYLVMALTTAPWFAIMQSFRSGGEGALLGHIREGRLVFELSILSGALGLVAYLMTAVLLYQRYKAEAAVAVGMLFAFVVASVPISFVAISRQMELLALLDRAGASAADLQAQLGAILRSHDILVRLSSFFWGLWLLPLAWLAWRSRGSGVVVGPLLALGGLGYASTFVRPLLAPGGPLTPLDLAAAAASVTSELVVILWLLLAADRPRGPA
jgi:hypothetical protein